MTDKKTDQGPPRMSDPMEQFMNVGQRMYGPNFGYRWLKRIFDYPVPDDWERIIHYTRGGGGPFIDVKLYTELGVGWKLKAVGFEADEDGKTAKEIVDDEFKRRNFHDSMMQLAAFWRALGRAALVKTYTLDGEFYYSKQEKSTGLDVINPTTLTYDSIRRVVNDTTGKEMYKQEITGTDSSGPVLLEQDRVKFITNNPLTPNNPTFGPTSTVGYSDMDAAITDLRTLARFPHYRDEMGALYSTLLLVVTSDREALAKTEYGKELMASVEKAQEYLTDTANFYKKMRARSNIIANYEGETITPISFAGREVKLDTLEDQTLKMIAFRMQVPLALLFHAPDVNRATLETLADTWVASISEGSRKYVFTPIIEEVANEILRMNDITEGRLEVEYNPFLPKNLLQVSEVIRNLWSTGAYSKPDVRQKMDDSLAPNLGGDDWKDLNPMPIPQMQIPLMGKGQTSFDVEKIERDGQFKDVEAYLESRGLIKQL